MSDTSQDTDEIRQCRERYWQAARPDTITRFILFREYVGLLADCIESIAAMPQHRRGPEAVRLAQKLRDAASDPINVDACKRISTAAPSG